MKSLRGITKKVMGYPYDLCASHDAEILHSFCCDIADFFDSISTEISPYGQTDKYGPNIKVPSADDTKDLQLIFCRESYEGGKIVIFLLKEDKKYRHKNIIDPTHDFHEAKLMEAMLSLRKVMHADISVDEFRIKFVEIEDDNPKLFF